MSEHGLSIQALRQIWASTVNHALSVMGHARSRTGDVSVQVSRAEPGDGGGGEGPSSDSNTAPKSTKPLSDHNELPLFCRIPKDLSKSEELMELELDKKALVLELDRENATEDRDLRMELRYKEDLEARYNRRLQP